MKRIIYTAISILLSSNINAQNLVIDGSLEDTIKCPLSIGRFYHPTNTSEQYTTEWRATTLASPDYHNICGYNNFMPRTGEGYAGILYYDPTEYREYVTALLSGPLLAGERYYVEYYVALNAGSTQAVDQVQVHFSAGVPLDVTFPPPGPLSLTPHLQASSTPTDTIYQMISGCYSAVGGEDAITFGNFFDNAATTLTTVSAVGAVNAYYYIDDVSIILFDSSATQTGNTLSANMSGATYQWVDCGDSFSNVPGETSQDFTPTTSGTYAVVVTMGECSDTSACFTVNLGTGINEEEQGVKRVYPNPVLNLLTIDWKGNISSIELRDGVGRLMRRFGQLGGQSLEIDLSNFSSGLYFIHVENDQVLERYTVVKQ